MDKRKRPPWWFTTAIWASLAGTAALIAGAVVVATAP